MTDHPHPFVRTRIGDNGRLDIEGNAILDGCGYSSRDDWPIFFQVVVFRRRNIDDLAVCLVENQRRLGRPGDSPAGDVDLPAADHRHGADFAEKSILGAKLRLDPFTRGDVLSQDDDALWRRFDAELKPAHRAIFERPRGLELAMDPIAHHGLVMPEDLRPPQDRVDLQHRPAEQGLTGLMALSGRGGVDVQVSPVETNDDAAFIERIESLAESPLRPLQCFGGALPLGNVLGHDDEGGGSVPKAGRAVESQDNVGAVRSPERRRHGLAIDARVQRRPRLEHQASNIDRLPEKIQRVTIQKIFLRHADDLAEAWVGVDDPVFLGDIDSQQVLLDDLAKIAFTGLRARLDSLAFGQILPLQHGIVARDAHRDT